MTETIAPTFPTVANVEALLRRKLDKGETTGPEHDLVNILLPQVQEVVESWLNRAFGEREVTERLEPVDGILYPRWRPVIVVLAVTDDNGNAISFDQDTDETIRLGDTATSYLEPWSQTLRGLTVDYTAGEPSVPPSVRQFAAGVVARTVLTPAVVSLGAIGGYTVEGTSITYSPGVTGSSADAPAGWKVGELAAIERFQRLMIR